MFKIEEHISRVWSLVDEIETVRWALLDREEKPSEDLIDNMLLGLHSLLNARCEQLFNVYEAVLQEQYENNI